MSSSRLQVHWGIVTAQFSRIIRRQYHLEGVLGISGPAPATGNPAGDFPGNSLACVLLPAVPAGFAGRAIAYGAPSSTGARFSLEEDGMVSRTSMQAININAAPQEANMIGADKP